MKLIFLFFSVLFMTWGINLMKSENQKFDVNSLGDLSWQQVEKNEYSSILDLNVKNEKTVISRKNSDRYDFQAVYNETNINSSNLPNNSNSTGNFSINVSNLTNSGGGIYNNYSKMINNDNGNITNINITTNNSENQIQAIKTSSNNNTFTNINKTSNLTLINA